MSRMWPAHGPLVLPAVRQGTGYRCGCNPTYGDSCDRCDGTADEAYQASRATPEERRAAIRDLAAWRSRRADWAIAPTDDKSGDAA